MHHFVPAEIVDQRLTCLHGMENTSSIRSLEDGAQLHKPMTGAAGVESVKGDTISLGRIKRPVVGQTKAR